MSANIRLLNAAHALALAASDVLMEGEYDDLGSFIIRNTEDEDTIHEIDDLSEAVAQYRAARMVDDLFEPAPEPDMSWGELGKKVVNLIFWSIGVIYTVQLVTWGLAGLLLHGAWS